jgi:hypothetical protein
MEKIKIFLIVVFLYSFNLLSQDIIYQPAEKYFDKIIVEKSNYNFENDSTFNSELPDYLKIYAEGSIMKEFGSWDKFTSNFHMFDSVSSENTDDNWTKYRDKIIEQSKIKNLAHSSLKRCLKIIKKYNKELALLPISAYLCKNRNHDVWVIVCRWEYKDSINNIESSGWSKYGHIRQYAIDITDFNIIAFETCG